MKIVLLSLILILLSCTGKPEEKNVFGQETKPKETSDLKFEERIKREVEAKLSIPATETYQLEIKKAHLNADEKEDAVITVNRMELAQKEAADDKTGNRARLGYMGNYNYFFYYDGKIDKISIPMSIGSSGKAPLKASFDNIQSDIYQDLIIEYRIRNSAFRNYYVIENGSLALVFQWKLFDMVGDENYEANYIQYEPGSMSLAKDIIIYKGKIKNYSPKIPDVYSYSPEIEKNGPMLYRFFYDPASMKYMTKKQ
ncbi:MAG: hypothetical protein ACO1O6_09975 [Bacteroidota bacterium]